MLTRFKLVSVFLTMANHASHYLRTVGEDAIQRIPPGVASDHAALSVLAQVAQAGVRRAPPEVGQAALVAGQGVVGQLVVQFLKASACSPVIATDVVDSRLDKATLSGADLTLNAERDDVYAAVMAVTDGNGVERVYDATPVPPCTADKPARGRYTRHHRNAWGAYGQSGAKPLRRFLPTRPHAYGDVSTAHAHRGNTAGALDSTAPPPALSNHARERRPQRRAFDHARRASCASIRHLRQARGR